MIKTNVERLIRKYALQNAVQYGGIANASSVIGKVLAERSDLRSRAREFIQIAEKIVTEINKLPLAEQEKILAETYPEITAEKVVLVEKRKLPPLPNVEIYPFIHVRFCPNPDGALHLGGSRAAILCDEYAKMYNGKFTLRFDDTDPRTKIPIQEAYNWIKSDLKWLDVKWHNEVYQSDRLEIYYRYASRLIEMGNAYVCTCKTIEFRKRVLEHAACPCRDLPPEEHLKRWLKMLDGTLNEGEAVVRLKTDLNHPNPAVREWLALRIINVNRFPHPRTGNKYRVWPLFAFCCGIDDHELQISHVIRGKEHLTNSVRQLFLFNYLHWEYPDSLHYGRFKIIGSVLSKSKINKGILDGIYNGWDDPRLGTLMALRRRGFLPETIRQLIIETGPKPVDVTISWDNLQAMNRKLLDPIADRYFFIPDPIELKVHNVNKAFTAKLNLHPSDPKRGIRSLTVTPENGLASFLIAKNDLKIFEKKKIIRLIGLFNITIKSVTKQVEAEFHSETYEEAKKADASLIHWLPYDSGIKASVVMPDASTIKGFAEDTCRKLKIGNIIQFERFGFVRVDLMLNGEIETYFAHR